MKATMAPLNSILTQRTGEAVQPEAAYPIAGVYGFGRGILTRPPIRGTDTTYKTLTRLREGDVVYSKLKAFEGAITVTGPDAEGHFVSPEFPVFSISADVNPRYLDHMLKTSAFLESLAANIHRNRSTA